LEEALETRKIEASAILDFDIGSSLLIHLSVLKRKSTGLASMIVSTTRLASHRDLGMIIDDTQWGGGGALPPYS